MSNKQDDKLQKEIEALRAQVAADEARKAKKAAALRAKIAAEAEGKPQAEIADMPPEDAEQSRLQRLLSPDISTWRHRFVLQLFPWALLMGIYWFFGPLSLIQQSSRSDIGFDMLTALPYYLAAFVLLTAAGAALCALVRGKHFSRIAVAVFILGLASYLQALLLNPNTGLLKGNAINWAAYARGAKWNLAVWVLLAIAVALLCYALKGHKYKLIAGASVLLLLMQTVDFGVNIADMVNERKDTRFVFHAEEQLVVSENENVILFVLDSFSNRAVREVETAFPGAFDFLHDFTNYTNYGPSYYATFPEMIHLLTGEEYRTDQTWREFQQSAWRSEKSTLFFSELEKRGYTRQFLSTEGLMAPTREMLEGIVDNMNEATFKIRPFETFRQVGNLTLFRYVPTVCKPLFWVTPNDFLDVSQSVVGSSGRVRDARYTANDVLETEYWNGLGEAFYDVICEQPLDTTENNMFTYYHFHGPHTPYITDENLNTVESGTDLPRQGVGYLRMVEQYLERTKELGVYDDATIVILADHGDQIYEDSPRSAGAMLYVKLPGERHDVSPVNDIAVLDESLLPTMMQGINPELVEKLGTPLNEVKEGDNPARTMRRLEFDASVGAGAMFYTFHYTGHVNDLADLTNPDEIELLVDCFW